MQKGNVTLIEHGDDFQAIEAFARSQAQEAEGSYLSPTNDFQLMAGQVGFFSS